MVEAAEPMGSHLVEAQDLHVRLGGRDVLRGVSFAVQKGDCYALVGESGSGKTVTARVVTGSIGHIGGTVMSGRFRFDGVDLAQDDVAAWRAVRGRRIAAVPQASLSSLDPIMRVGRQLVETIRVLDPGVDARARAEELLDQVEMPRVGEVMKSFPHELSGGMRQRIMIALALALALAIAARPDLIVADEPTTALDVTVQAAILKLLAELRSATRMTMLLIAHDLAVVGEVADRVGVMRGGEIVECGSTGTVLSRPNHPYTTALLAARPESAVAGQPLAVLDASTNRLVRPVASTLSSARSDLIAVARSAGKAFRGSDSMALAPLDLEVRHGDAVGVVGESGSGKTTLGRLLVGALAPSTGSVEVGGRSWNAVTRGDPMRRDVQMIFQDPYGSLTPWRTPREIVAEVIRHWWGPMSRVAARDEAGALLDEVGLPDGAKDRRPSKLSGGQCQRVGIARALAARPSLLVADEPTSSLDISTQAQIVNLLLALRASPPDDLDDRAAKGRGRRTRSFGDDLPVAEPRLHPRPDRRHPDAPHDSVPFIP